jgi:hypothetical protein
VVSEVVDALARPRVGIVLPAGEDAWVAAVAARTVVLAMLRRLPWARVEVLIGGAGASVPSMLDCGRPPRPLARGGGDRQRVDVLVAVGGAKVGGRSGGGACPVVPLIGTALDVALLAAPAAAGELARNRAAMLRLLGWLPAAGTPHAVVDADEASVAAVAGGLDAAATGVAVVATDFAGELDADAACSRIGAARCLALPRGEAGVDEVVAAICSAVVYVGAHPLLTAVAVGAGVPVSTEADSISAALSGSARPASAPPPDIARALDAALDSAAGAAVDCWRGRGSPGAVPDPAPSRREGAEQASLRVEIRRLERELDALSLHANHLDGELRQVVGSRTWRYSETARGLYRAARQRLRG